MLTLPCQKPWGTYVHTPSFDLAQLGTSHERMWHILSGDSGQQQWKQAVTVIRERKLDCPMLPASMQTDSPVRQGRQDKGLAADNKSSGYSDAKSNCSKKSLEVLIGKQGAKDEASNEVITFDEEKEDNKYCCPQQTGRPVSRQVKGLDDVVDIIHALGVKKPPDKGPSTEGPGGGGVSAPHNNDYELLSASTMYTL
jgi:hypothetical protein